MNYFDIIANDVNIIFRRLDSLAEYLENEYKKTPSKKNSQTIRKYANEIFEKIERIEFLKMKLNNFLKRINYIAEYNLGKININQIKTIANIMEKMSKVIDATNDNEKLIRFVNKIAKVMDNIHDEEQNDDSIIELSLEEMNNLKIGALTRYILKRLTYVDKFTQVDIESMQNKEWCTNVLKLYNPLIKKKIEGQDELEQRKIDGNIKYFQKSILIKGDKFFISNELYEKSRESLIRLYKIKTDILHDIDDEILNYNLENDNDDEVDLIIKEEFDDIEQEYFSDPFKILNWLDNSNIK